MEIYGLLIDNSGTSLKFLIQVDVPLSKRQFAHSPGVLLVNPAETTDPFVLFSKAIVLMSEVKAFNGRFRVKNFNGDPMNQSNDGSTMQASSQEQPEATTVDPRQTSSFRAVECLVSSFISSFPVAYRTFFVGSAAVEFALLIAHVVPKLFVDSLSVLIIRT